MDAVETRELWFPEPAVPNPYYSPATGRPEPITEWLAKSTVPRAVALRRVLNAHLAEVPPAYAAALYRRMPEQFPAAYFELTVGRTLHVLGASIAVEIPNPDGTRLDFLAEFPDGMVAVEATVPLYNPIIGQEQGIWDGLRHVITGLAPPGWIVFVEYMPLLESHQGYSEFRRVVGDLFRGIGAPEDHTPRLHLQTTHEQEEGLGWGISLELVPRRERDRPVEVVGPGTGYFDNTEEAIRKVERRKRRQARTATVPVLLAVFAADIADYRQLETFDMALFGRTVAYVGGGVQVATEFGRSGVWTRGEGSRRAVFAGVLAFVNQPYTGGRDPVLYLHPRFEGPLPKALMGLEQRRYADGPPRVIGRQPRVTGVLDRMEWVDRHLVAIPRGADDDA